MRSGPRRLAIPLLALLGGCVSTPRGPLADLGLPNFENVDGRLYRGGQPSAEGLAELAREGVVTVVDLRRAGEAPPSRAAERESAERLRLEYLPVRLSPIAAPPRATMVRLLEVISDPRRQPVFVHCQRGADRTGTAVAVYRISRDCWSAREAIAEARRHGMAWFEFGMRRFIRAWHREVSAAGCTPAG
jgi:protein tyrosine/serine phosphatase